MAIQKGIQLFSVRHLAQKDLIGTIAKMAEMGYDGVEFAGYFDHSAAQLRQALADLGVKAAGSHIAYDMFTQHLDELMAFSAELGLKNLVCPFIPEEKRNSRDAWLRTAEDFDRIGARLAAEGFVLGYHNHGSDFEEFDGVFGIDLLYGNTSAKNVKMQLDVGNAEVTGKVKALDFMRKYADRCELVHVKDMAAVGDDTPVAVGEGVLDIPAIVKLGKELGAQWFTVEYEAEQGD
ncbi:MAG: TIM barrel protein, partial [Eubacteriales bacterium]|nr:TIM barrel protein [Eubacteriales bacterium]